MRIGIIGDGGWGTALALVLARNGHQVCAWGPQAPYIDQLRATRENVKFLPGVALPEELAWTADTKQLAADAQAIVLATPSHYFREVLARFAGGISPNTPIISVTKGLDEQTFQRMTEVAEEALGHQSVAALSGPSLAPEVAREVPTAVTIACRHVPTALFFQQLFNHPVFRVYTSDDVIGVEMGGALKNIIAIAAGVCDGLGYGDNSKAALITRGLAEMTRLGCAVGAHPATFSGLSGMGDLVVTCGSKKSRNRGVGERLGRGEKAADILAGMEQVAEGAWTCVGARSLARSRNIEAPITNEVFAIIHEGKSPRQAVRDLLGRDPKPERN